MFAHNPLPMWVYDRETHVFLDVNDAALEKYGYAREEFLSMKIEEIRPAEDLPRFREYIDTVSETVHQVTHWNHRKKDGTVLDVEVTAQEAIDNTLKHAQASRIDLRLVQQDTLLKLTVSDDGIGLPATNPRGEGMGLRIMDYRARIIGGTFAVQPGADGGTLVICLFLHTSVQQPADEAHATESLTRG